MNSKTIAEIYRSKMLAYTAAAYEKQQEQAGKVQSIAPAAADITKRLIEKAYVDAMEEKYQIALDKTKNGIPSFMNFLQTYDIYTEICNKILKDIEEKHNSTNAKYITFVQGESED